MHLLLSFHLYCTFYFLLLSSSYLIVTIQTFLYSTSSLVYVCTYSTYLETYLKISPANYYFYISTIPTKVAFSEILKNLYNYTNFCIHYPHAVVVAIIPSKNSLLRVLQLMHPTTTVTGTQLSLSIPLLTSTIVYAVYKSSLKLLIPSPSATLKASID